MALHTPRSQRPQPRRATAARSSLRELLSRTPDLLVDVAANDRVAIAGERLVPGQDGVVVASEFEKNLAVVILNDRVGAELIGCLLQIVEGEIELAVFEIRPADAIEVGAVVGIDR